MHSPWGKGEGLNMNVLLENHTDGRWASPFSPFANRLTSICFFVNNWTNNGLRNIAWASVFIWCLYDHVSMSLCSCLHVSISLPPCPCLQVSRIPQTKNKTNGKRQLMFVFCKQQTETANFRLFAANGKQTFFFFGRQTINVNRHLMFQQLCPSKHVRTLVGSKQMVAGTLDR